MQPDDESKALTLVAARLRTRFPNVDSDTIAATVARFHLQYDGRPIRDLIPVLVERDARDHLRTLTRHGTPMPETAS